MRRSAIAVAVIIALLAVAAVASGELVQDGNLRLAFNGSISPKKLPRKTAVPVTMAVSGAIHTANGDKPPELRKISIAFNRFGQVSTKGLPSCDQDQLEQTTSEGALEACRDALVGHGSFRAFFTFPGLDPVAVKGDALAFFSSANGKPALLLHIFGSRPVKVTFVIPFAIHHIDSGTFGTSFTAKIPKIAGESGYVTDISLTFFRTYEYQGERRSFLSARCAVPVGIPGAVFNLARGSFTFSNGQRLDTPLSRNCWAR